MNSFRVVFIGLNNETLSVLSKSPHLNIIGVNYFEYFDHFSLNPFNQLFRLAYKMHYLKWHKVFCWAVFKIWSFFSFLSSKIYKDNKYYLQCILERQIQILVIENTGALSAFIKENNVDLIVINSWGLLSQEILQLPKYSTLNIHPSKLPEYRGALPTLWSLKNKDRASAVTYIILNEIIDGGLIVGQHSFNISDTDDWLQIEKKVDQIVKETLVDDALNYLQGVTQGFTPTIPATSTGKYNLYREIVLEQESFIDIYNKVGLYPYLEPFFYCFLRVYKRNIYIKRIFLVKKHSIALTPGTLKLSFRFLWCHAKDGILKSRLFIDISIKDSLFIILYKIFNKI